MKTPKIKPLRPIRYTCMYIFQMLNRHEQPIEATLVDESLIWFQISLRAFLSNAIVSTTDR